MREKENYHIFKKIDTKIEEFLNSSYSNWYELFRKNVIKSIVLKPVPKSFINYLLSDGLKVPFDDEKKKIIVDDELDEMMECTYGKNENSNDEIEEYENDFILFHDKIKKSIEQLDYSVFPKLNWSAPKDAQWINPRSSTECKTTSDIYLMLKASDHILDDLECLKSLNNNDQNISFEFELVLKKWFDFNPSLEFRIFVVNSQIIGVSQKEMVYYDFLNLLKSNFSKTINSFFDNEFIPKITDYRRINHKNSEVPFLDRCILDVYIPKPYNKLYLIDINAFTRKSDSLLFTWNELLCSDIKLNEKPVYDFRLVEKDQIINSYKKKYSESQVPFDVVNNSKNVDEIVEFIKEWESLNKNEKSD